MVDMVSTEKTERFREAVTKWAATAEPGDPATELAAELGVRTAVLLEGPSDVAAVETLAAARGRDLPAEGVCVLSMGGAMNVARYARLLSPSPSTPTPTPALRLTGLCDERERPYYTRAFNEVGAPRQAIHVCTADLEDELIRSLGAPRVMELIEAEGDLRPLRTFLNQPAQRGRSTHQQLRRFFGTTSGRKIHYGGALVAALPPDRTPTPLHNLLTTL
ncbi:TOPRIM nucleotidyl transferase/hydrolase domain-containing protein [Streptomyces sp. NPDC091280]|uniref:TOPRIM nucleotidyl transferase/hydrolase domain-containing protein n=1 Tax=Streptomyces sp. NPDC091280 TaxID=3365984 RepID=UPI0037F8DA5F